MTQQAPTPKPPRAIAIPHPEILYRIATHYSERILSTPPIGPDDDRDYERRERAR